MLVAASSVIESANPSMSRSAEIRTALLVPTNIAEVDAFPARCSTPCNRYCWLSARQVIRLSWLP